jgi:hypothetical protein
MFARAQLLNHGHSKDQLEFLRAFVSFTDTQVIEQRLQGKLLGEYPTPKPAR